MVLFEIIFEIARDAFVEVNTVSSRHIMSLGRIDKEVGLRTGIDAGAHEREGVLRHAGGVVASDDDLQASLQVGGMVEQAALGIAFGVAFGGVHIALAVHHLVVFPVDDGASGNAHLEGFGVARHHRNRHEASEAPAMHADAVFVNEAEAFQPFHALHLVFGFFGAEVTEGAVLKFQSAVRAAAIVECKDDIAQLRHVDVPASDVVVPASADILDVRAAIDIDDSRVLLAGIEVGGFHHAVVEVRDAVGSLYRSDGDFGHVVVLPGIFGGKKTLCLARAGIDKVNSTRNVRGAPCVDNLLAAIAQAGVMHASPFAQQRALAVLQRNAPEGALQGRGLTAVDEDTLAGFVEADDAFIHPRTRRHLLDEVACGGIEIKVVIAVALAEIEEFVLIPGEEGEGMLRLDVLFVPLLKEHSLTIACGGIVAHQLGMVLVAVQLDDIDFRSVGVPADVGEVAVGGITRLEPDGFFCYGVEDAHRDHVAGHACHRVFVRDDGGYAGGEVGLRVVRDHAFVHTIEGQQASVGVPESARFVEKECVFFGGF